MEEERVVVRRRGIAKAAGRWLWVSSSAGRRWMPMAEAATWKGRGLGRWVVVLA